MKKTIHKKNNDQQFNNNHIPQSRSKNKINRFVIVILVIAAVLVFIRIFISITSMIIFLFTIKHDKYGATYLSSEYSYYDEYGRIKKYPNQPGHKSIEDISNIPEFDETEFDGTYTDDTGQYARYTSTDMTYKIYKDEETDSITKLKLSFNSSSSLSIKENELYDSVLQNRIAFILMGICDYSWENSQNYLDGFSLADGIDETDENGYHFSLNVDSPEITFTITMPK